MPVEIQVTKNTPPPEISSWGRGNRKYEPLLQAAHEDPGVWCSVSGQSKNVYPVGRKIREGTYSPIYGPAEVRLVTEGGSSYAIYVRFPAEAEASEEELDA